MNMEEAEGRAALSVNVGSELAPDVTCGSHAGIFHIHHTRSFSLCPLAVWLIWSNSSKKLWRRIKCKYDRMESFANKLCLLTLAFWSVPEPGQWDAVIFYQWAGLYVDSANQLLWEDNFPQFFAAPDTMWKLEIPNNYIQFLTVFQCIRKE